MRTILVLDFDDEKLADIVGQKIASRFDLVTKRLGAQLPSVRVRGWQLNAEDLLSEVSRLSEESGSDMALGLINRDLYVPDMNFVFGIASRDGRSAIISAYRLKASEPKLFLQRLLKETVHELGHVFGLTHCDDIRCVMHFSNSLADTDIKTDQFCDRCSSRLSDV